MRLILPSLALCLASFGATALAKTALVPAKTAKVYMAVDGTAEVTVVELEPISKGDVLLMVDHSNSALDGLILKHKTKIQGQAQAYVIDVEGGGERTRMRANEGSWYKQYVMYLPEAPTKEIQLTLNIKASKKVKTDAIVKAFEAQDLKAVKAKVQKAYDL